MEEHDFFEVIGTQRAMRHLKPDPVPPELVDRLLWAATRAPSGGNAQNWRFIVVTEPETKRRLQEIYRGGEAGYAAHLRAAAGDETAEAAPAPPEITPERARSLRSARHLTEHLHEAPVIIIACVFPQEVNQGVASGASIYPAVQNLLLCARALGLGATLTTIYLWNEDELRDLLGIPPTVKTGALIPIGWPQGKFGPGLRKPVETVTYYERWGQR